MEETMQPDVATLTAMVAAYEKGVRHELAQDAVTLAIVYSERDGVSVEQALDSVLQRHPEWVSAAGFQIGTPAQPPAETTLATSDTVVI